MIRAFHAADGRELWSVDTTPPFVDVRARRGHGGSIDSVGAVVAGTDVLVNSGYNSFGHPNQFQAGPGNALLIFRLPADAADGAP